MKQSLKTILAATMSVFMLFGSACKSSSGKGNKEETQQTSYSGTHIYTMTETEDYLIENGKTDYVIVAPEDASNYIRTALTEFRYLFKMATNIGLSIVNDTGLEHSKNAKYISIGQTTLLETCGEQTSSYSYEKLTRDGGRIFTVDDTIYIVGGCDTGTLYAVYTFMNLTFNYESYSSSCIEIDKNVTERKLMDYDVTDIPDFKSRHPGWGVVKSNNFSQYDDVNFMYRMRYESYNHVEYVNVHQVYDDPNNAGEFLVDDKIAATSTNTNTIINRERTYGSHPKWFSDAGNQWCYTAHGDAEELELMVKAVTESVKYSLMTYDKVNNPYARIINISHEDNDFFCTCDACSACLSTYGGAYSAPVVKFMNMVSDKLNAWFDEKDSEGVSNREKYRYENFGLSFFAYGPTDMPPAKYDEATKKWEPIDDSVILREDIVVRYANIGLDYQQSPYAEDNGWGDDYLNGWTALTDRISYYLYTVQCRSKNYFFDTFNHMTSEGFQYYLEKSDELMYVEGDGNLTPSVWGNLMVYLQSKLAWNCSLDEEVLIDNFFKAMYGPGASYMKEFFTAQRIYCSNEYQRVGFYNRKSMYNSVSTKCTWPIQVVQSWIDYCDKALEAVEPIKYTDAVAYDNYCKYIEMEVASPIVIMIEQNGGDISKAQKKQYLDRLSNDLSKWDFSGMIATGTNSAYTILPDWIDQQEKLL